MDTPNQNKQLPSSLVKGKYISLNEQEAQWFNMATTIKSDVGVLIHEDEYNKHFEAAKENYTLDTMYGDDSSAYDYPIQ